MTLEFFVPGEPKPAGSKSGFPIRRKDGSVGVAMRDSSGTPGKQWRSIVTATARDEAYRVGWPKVLKPVPVMVEMRFCKPRPQTHYNATGSLRKSAPSEYVTTRPDALKLTRAVEDAMTDAGVWEDDSQVQFEGIRKVWVDRSATGGVFVRCRLLEKVDQ